MTTAERTKPPAALVRKALAEMFRIGTKGNGATMTQRKIDLLALVITIHAGCSTVSDIASRVAWIARDIEWLDRERMTEFAPETESALIEALRHINAAMQLLGDFASNNECVDDDAAAASAFAFKVVRRVLKEADEKGGHHA